RGRYGAAGRKEKQRILDEFCETTGMHRKAAIRLLNRERGPAAGRRGRPRRYGPEVGEALVRVWEVGDRMCSKLLVAVMPDLVDALERHGELQLRASDAADGDQRSQHRPAAPPPPARSWVAAAAAVDACGQPQE
ncbi:MAG: hypothetical protein KJZ93_32645, partial [Caldilineaceae bacterium]|nr:hypothetical protein [Caldilineaceae bacterium]